MMIAVVKLVIGLFAVVSVNFIDTYESIEAYNAPNEAYTSGYSGKDLKVKAFQILENKCDVRLHELGTGVYLQ